MTKWLPTFLKATGFCILSVRDWVQTSAFQKVPLVHDDAQPDLESLDITDKKMSGGKSGERAAEVPMEKYIKISLSWLDRS